jgi:hypothetical protein
MSIFTIKRLKSNMFKNLKDTPFNLFANVLCDAYPLPYIWIEC